jgi:hypothetical protein
MVWLDGAPSTASASLNPNSEMGMAAVSKRGIIAVRRKAVLKHTQSKRWREVWCGPAIAKRLDCVRFIAALSRPFLTRSAAKTLHVCPPASEFGFILQHAAGRRRSRKMRSENCKSENSRKTCSRREVNYPFPK